MAADVMSTKVVNETLNEFTEDSLLAWERAKQGGLTKALAFAQNSDGAKMLGLKVFRDISQEAYEDLLKNKITMLTQLSDYAPINNNASDNFYAMFYFEKFSENTDKYLIDSIFIQ
jgi:Fe-S cluster biosynthesis and repair protein YggX